MRPSLIFLATVGLIVSGACSYHRAHIDHEDYGDLPIRNEPVEGEALGPVAANDGGFLWTNCTKAAEGSLWILVARAREMGGNAIGDLQWIPKRDKPFDRPTCRRKWGFVLVWPVVFTPAFMSVRVEGIAYRVEDSGTAAASSLYLLPDSPEELSEVVAKILADIE